MNPILNIMIQRLYRIIRKNKIDFLINLIGLSVAMLVFILTTLYVKDETSFDTYHQNADQIFRLTTSIVSPNGQCTNMALANTTFGSLLKNECPEIKEIACIDVGNETSINYQGTEFGHISIRAATPSVFKLFSYAVLKGNPDEFLQSPNTIVLTRSIAKKIFNQSEPIGQRVSIRKDDYVVTGVIKDLPTNTDLTFSALVPSKINGTEELTEWDDYYVYLQTKFPSTQTLTDKVEALTKKNYDEVLQQMGGFQLKHHIQPLKSIHFDNSLVADSPKGNKTMVYVFSVIALLILVIAGINYINITMAQLQKRQKEFAIRKAIGCNRKGVISQILTESVFTTLLAAILSIVLATLCLSQFNSLFDKRFDLLSILRLLVPLFFLFFGFGIISGLYPAYQTLKPAIKNGTGFNFFGKTLVTFQNIVTIAMISGVILIWSQISFMKNYNLGFDKQQLIAVQFNDPDRLPDKDVIRNEFSRLPEVKALAFGGGGTNMGKANWMKAIMVAKDDEGNDIQFVLNEPSIDENYLSLLGIQLIEGRNFTASIADDRTNSVIINETYARTMGWTEPLGKYIFENNKLKVIGVVKDFNFEALHNPVEPLMFQMLREEPAFLFIKTEPRNLEIIRNHWEKISNGVPFEYSFIDKHMNELYKKDEKNRTIFSCLTLIALIISSLGLYGLISHFNISRTKEIGIRKVNGARISEIILLLNKDLIKWVIVAFFIATPVAWYVMNRWLENFAYKTELSWWIFAFSGIIALGIAIFTVSIHSLKAANRNPVEALRYE